MQHYLLLKKKELVWGQWNEVSYSLAGRDNNHTKYVLLKGEHVEGILLQWERGGNLLKPVGAYHIRGQLGKPVQLLLWALQKKRPK